mgnify:CR=1 FL=1
MSPDHICASTHTQGSGSFSLSSFALLLSHTLIVIYSGRSSLSKVPMSVIVHVQAATFSAGYCSPGRKGATPARVGRVVVRPTKKSSFLPSSSFSSFSPKLSLRVPRSFYTRTKVYAAKLAKVAKFVKIVKTSPESQEATLNPTSPFLVLVLCCEVDAGPCPTL